MDLSSLMQPSRSMMPLKVVVIVREFIPNSLYVIIFKGELLAIILFVERFKYFLTLRHFILRTDSAALKYLHTMKAPSRMLVRWLETLANFSFTVLHRPGSRHADCDQLSRIEHAQPDPKVNNQEEERTLGALGTGQIFERWKETVESDSDLELVLRVVSEKRAPTTEELVNASADTNLYLRMIKHLYFDQDGRLRIEDVFATRSAVERGQPRGLLVTPSDLQLRLMTMVHEDGGCMGREATVTQARRQFYWPRMAATAEKVHLTRIYF